MKKDKYLKEIEKRLDFLTEEDKQTEIFRINNSLEAGEVLNDISVEVENIRSKYKYRTRVKVFKFSDKVEQFIKKIKKNSFKENIIIVRDIILLILFISFLKIPFITVETLLLNFVIELVPVSAIDLVNIAIELIYVVFAIFLFIKIFKKRFAKELDN